jgi:tight adherence protein C
MSVAVVVAALAGLLGAVGVVDLVEVVMERRTAEASVVGGAAGRAGRWATAVTRLGRRLGPPAPPGGLGARLLAAGLPASVRPADVMAAKAGGAVVAVLLGMPVAAALPGRLMILALAGALAGGFAAPDLWLARRARQRAARARLELADVLDLLCVALRAGLPVDRALEEVGARRRGLVAAELRRLAVRRRLGIARADGLSELRTRLPVPTIATLVAALERADRHGAPPAPALAALAHEARTDRARRLQEHAAGAAPRIQLAIALLLVPAVLLLVAAGLVHGLAGGPA